ncbi:sulfate/molybdate ABC transporter ATP-binding protein [Microbacterium sp. RD1]|uniref:sulfate/molybdate ABC transporter ATP-binding protein n=1 Tax=Microbacterium sp. RD1 TaxID=3457313 RepID=UPI003FA59F65
MSGLSARIRVPREHFDVSLSLEVAAGETVAIMGPSGAGKSTVLNALAGLVPLGEGEIRVGDRVVERAPVRGRLRVPPMRRGVVLLGQDARLFPHLNARDNVAFGPRATGTPRAQAAADADVWLARVGLDGAGGRRPAELSGGEQQRVAVARALAASPRAVLLDEPLVALDPVTAAEIRAMLREQLSGVTTVAVTHDAVDAAALADRLLVLEAGSVTQSGLVRTVLAEPATPFVAALAGLNRVDGEAGAGRWVRGDVRLRSADAASHARADGSGRPLAAVFRPAAVRLVPTDAVENAWTTTVDRLESTPTGVRMHAQWCAVDLDAASATALAPGTSVRLSVAPADVRFLPCPAG